MILTVVFYVTAGSCILWGIYELLTDWIYESWFQRTWFDIEVQKAKDIFIRVRGHWSATEPPYWISYDFMEDM